MSLSVRPALVGVVVGAAVAATAAVNGSAFGQPATTTVTSARSQITGSVPAWAVAANRVGSVVSSTRRQIEIALAPRDPRGARALATAVSTPGNPLFRHPVTATEYAARFGPSQETVDAVETWLRGQGLQVTGLTGNRQVVSAVGRADRLEAAFGVRLDTFRTLIHGQGRTLAAPDSPVTVPAALAGRITAVLGLDDSAATITPAQAHVPVLTASPNAAGAGCATSWGSTNNAAVPQKYPTGSQSNVLCGYTTAPLRAMYGLGSGDTGGGVDVAIVGAYNDTNIVSDTDHAASDFGSPQLAPGQYQAFLPSGGFSSNPNCNVDSWMTEQALDVQAVHTEAPAAGLLYYPATDCTTLVVAFEQAVSTGKASVITDSWDYTGESTVPADVRTAFENAAVEAAAQGQTVLFSTGDEGDDSTTAGTAEANFPAVDPWVTAVGGTTTGLDTSRRTALLTGWADIGNVQTGSTWTPLPPTSGGFPGGAGGGRSSLYAEPTYQDAVVPAALSGGHRAIPDIAADADPFTGMAIGVTTAHGYVEEPIGGTSEASPLTAGLAADAGQRVGGGGWLGLINPALYQMTSPAITDVTDQKAGVWTPFAPVQGTSTQGSYLIDVGSRPQSLVSQPGWDNETGLGTPNAGFIAALTAAAG
jgi:subtilase family serine protease